MWQIIGHDRPVHLLQKSVESGRVSHAYLFSGPRHVGKLTLALELAKALNCQERDRPCGRCRSCQKIERGVHPDVQVVDLEEGAKNIGIEVVRGIQDGVALRPSEGQAKLYIFVEVERLSEAAANALLKTLEEPPPSVVMVLTALDPSALLPTMVSRCQQVDLLPVPTRIIEEELRRRTGMAAEEARLLASLSRGRVGWALRAIANGSVLRRRAAALERLAALPGASRVDRLSYAAELASLWGRDLEAAQELLESWQSWWRDLLLCRLGLGDRVTNLDMRERLEAEAGRYSAESLGRMVKAIQETASLLAQNVNTRLALEVLLLEVPRA